MTVINLIVCILNTDLATVSHHQPAVDDVASGLPPLEQHAIDAPPSWRDDLEDHGISSGAELTIDWTRNFMGGQRTGAGQFHLFAFEVELDLEPLIDWAGGSIFIEFNAQDGDDFSERLVGDAQNYSNISEERRTQIAQLWFEQWLADDAMRIVIGKMDANDEFASVTHGTAFLNSSMGFSPTIVGLPTYPDPAMSINAFFYPYEHFSVGIGVYNGAAQRGIRTGSRGPKTFFHSTSDLFLIGEIGTSWLLGDETMNGRLGLGGWHHTGRFERFDGGNSSGTSGFYVVAEQELWHADPSADNASRPIAAFIQYGYANPAISEVHHHLGGGIVWHGPIPHRLDDLFGLGASWVQFSSETGAPFADHSETTIEMFYQISVTPWLTITPDIQLIHQPGGMGNSDAVAGTIRVVLEF